VLARHPEPQAHHKDPHSRLTLQTWEHCHCYSGSITGKTKNGPALWATGCIVQGYPATFRGNLLPRVRNNIKSVTKQCLQQRLLVSSLPSNPLLIFLKWHSAWPFNFIVMVDFWQTKRLKLTAVVLLAGSCELLQKASSLCQDATLLPRQDLHFREWLSSQVIASVLVVVARLHCLLARDQIMSTMVVSRTGRNIVLPHFSRKIPRREDWFKQLSRNMTWELQWYDPQRTSSSGRGGKVVTLSS
jgi:hypothetical protein